MVEHSTCELSLREDVNGFLCFQAISLLVDLMSLMRRLPSHKEFLYKCVVNDYRKRRNCLHIFSGK